MVHSKYEELISVRIGGAESILPDELYYDDEAAIAISNSTTILKVGFNDGSIDADNNFGGNLDTDFWRERDLELILKLAPYSLK